MQFSVIALADGTQMFCKIIAGNCLLLKGSLVEHKKSKSCSCSVRKIPADQGKTEAQTTKRE